MDTRTAQDVNTLSTHGGHRHNILCEQNILGALLIDNDLFERLGELSAADFYDPLHGEIFDTIERTIQSGNVAAPASLSSHFDGVAVTGDLLAGDYIQRLADSVTSLSRVPTDAKTIHALGQLRRLHAIGQELVASADDWNLADAPTLLIEDVEQALFKLAEKPQAGQSLSLADAVEQAITAANEARMRGTGLSGLATGIRDLDIRLGGLAPTDLIVLAGRPSMGKTALALNIAHAAAKAGAPVDFYSMEMSALQLAMRELGDISGISAMRLRRGDFEATRMHVLLETQKILAGLPIQIDQSAALTIAQLAMRARRKKRTHGTQLIIVDYIQLMRGTTRQGRVADITEITMGLKALAKELEVPIIALSQLSRQVEQRDDKRPQLSDLRESGSIEQDADVVLFVYRDEYYLSRAQPPEDDLDKTAKWEEAMRNASGSAEIIIAKQRHGETGLIKVSFDASATRFSGLAADGGAA
jgi:replicative DNA helicase